MKPRTSAITLAFLAFACSDPVGPPSKITALPRALTSQEQGLIAADNRFAIKLLKQAVADTRDTLPNLFVSPLSVAMALAMTYNGAAGTTEDAMRATLELEGMSVAEVNESYRSLIKLLRELDPRVAFTIANSIWYLDGYAVEPDFLDANRIYYDARVTALDFGSPTAPATINDWVKQQTRGVIDKIIDQIPDGMRMYLIDAIYFKGDWTEQFDRSLTGPRPFYLSDGSTVNVPTMTHGREAKLRSTWRTNATIIDLAYGGQAFSMTIVLPNDSVSVDDLVNGLTLDEWNAWTASLQPGENVVYLPKFKITNDLQLIPTLAALGMGVAFDPPGR
ncbi:MAG TPA: serpin family protein [Gemmatimonadales bacterium]|nr:serpin family protein [Gemmatimonadales bacterium]